MTKSRLDSQRPSPTGPKPTREQMKFSFKLDPELEMQPRSLRAKNWAYLGAFGLWYFVVVSFIVYRLKSDDLVILEKEAEERMRVRRMTSKLAKSED